MRGAEIEIGRGGRRAGWAGIFSMEGANDGEWPPPQQQGFEMAEIDVVEAEMRQVTPLLASELSDLFEELKEHGLTTRRLIAEFAKTHTAVAELLCKKALAGEDGENGGIHVMIGAAALLSRLGQVGAATSTAAPRGSSAWSEPATKRPKKEAWFGAAVVPKLGPASALVALPQHLAEEAKRIQLGHDESRPLTTTDAQSWVDSCRLWVIKHGIVNHEDVPGVLHKVRRPTHPTHLRPHRPYRHPALDR